MSEIAARTNRTLLGTIICRVVVPAYVLLGAALKFISADPNELPRWIQAAVGAMVSPEEIYRASMILLQAIVSAEIVAAGIMIFIGRLARPVAGLILAVFAFVLIAEIVHSARVSGTTFADALLEGDCGCFGSFLPVPPGAMLVIDLALLSLVALLPTGSRPLKQTPRWAMGALAVWVIAGLILAANPPQARTRAEIDWAYRTPRTWVGKHYSETYLFKELLPGYDPDSFGGGQQLWVLYSRSCHVCHNLFTTELAEPPEETKVIAVHVPHHHGTHAEEEEIFCPHCEFLELPHESDWAVSVPTMISIDETGVISRVRDVQLEPHAQQEQGI